jgi:hypothetical protein
MSTIKEIAKQLGIDERYTKALKQPKVFNKVKDNIPLKADYNFMADLLFLPTSKRGFKYLLVMVDLANNEFDIEEMRNKESATVLQAMKLIFARGILKKPYASIRTDAGSEFKGVFHKYLYDQNIMQKVALTNRHTQLANVESLNKQLGRLFNGYMNKKELETAKPYTNWTDIIGAVRTKLNKARKKVLPKDPTDYPYAPFDSSKIVKKGKKTVLMSVQPKYKVGDRVHRMLDYPKNALGIKQSGTFRQGDFRYEIDPRKVEQIFYYAGSIPYRYKLSGISNASFSESQMMEA